MPLFNPPGNPLIGTDNRPASEAGAGALRLNNGILEISDGTNWNALAGGSNPGTVAWDDIDKPTFDGLYQ
ncbi:MAG: hypothetical protein DDT31_00224 [Syntrophomonadaceae bacterium]|nr:hypothetical protein [Bacillota bacterium]